VGLKIVITNEYSRCQDNIPPTYLTLSSRSSAVTDARSRTLHDRDASQTCPAIGIPVLKCFIGMRKRFLGFTFERESYWMVVLYVLIPLLGILLGIVIPGLWRRWLP
jgi:hypothetical protein